MCMLCAIWLEAQPISLPELMSINEGVGGSAQEIVPTKYTCEFQQ